MFVIYFITLFTIVTSESRVNDTDLSKYIINNRSRRCFDSNEIIEYFSTKTEECSEILKYLNMCEGFEDLNNMEYPKENIWDGLILHHDLPLSHWHLYKSVFDKIYDSQQQEMAALSQWRENLQLVADHNQRYLAGQLSYSLHLNQFGDWDPEQYFEKILKLFDTTPLFDPSHDPHSSVYYQRVAHRSTPRQVDWRAKGFEPKREEQWQCGACYAFAVTHALQAQLYKRHGDWGELRQYSSHTSIYRMEIPSPQQIVDCSGLDGNLGCDGGSLRAAFRYAARSGLISEQVYPYTGKKGHCKYSFIFAGIRPHSWAMLPAGDEEAMEKALATIGPLAVAVNASPFTFQLYRSGVYDDPFCVPWGLNHAMLLVGYTPEYWILLNWWGKKWGEDGYIRIRRGFNRCGVANMATYVTL